MLDFSKDPASAARSVAPPRLRRQNAKINFPVGCAEYVRIISAVDGVVRPRESISALLRHTMPHKIKDDDEADPAAAAGETAGAGADAPAAVRGGRVRAPLQKQFDAVEVLGRHGLDQRRLAPDRLSGVPISCNDSRS